VEVVASPSPSRTAAAQCGLFTYKSAPVIFEPPCMYCCVIPRSTELQSSTRTGTVPHCKHCTGTVPHCKHCTGTVPHCKHCNGTVPHCKHCTGTVPHCKHSMHYRSGIANGSIAPMAGDGLRNLTLLYSTEYFDRTSHTSSTVFSVGLLEVDVLAEENRDEVCKVTSVDGTLRS
jgi:hypothetical protein